MANVPTKRRRKPTAVANGTGTPKTLVANTGRRRRRRQKIPKWCGLSVLVGVLFTLVVSMRVFRSRILQDTPAEKASREERREEAAETPTNMEPEKEITQKPTENHLPVLIIGGSDGSGTRGVVEILGHLGTPILSGDKVTKDVHAERLYNGGGWPALLRRVLNVTRSANYQFSDLPLELQKETMEQMQVLQYQYQDRVDKYFQGAYFFDKPLPSKIKYAFKAPATMLLLPILERAYGSIKFVHVVRDGRDIAFSANTSPVDKFYDVFYADSKARRELLLQSNETVKQQVMAIQLWNDWNTQVVDWCKKSGLDILTLRSEDLVNPDTRFDAIVQLADFVGSPKTVDEICCVSQAGLEDMGSSANAEKMEKNAKGLRGISDGAQVRGRYGKWVTKLKGNKELSDTLEREGYTALRAFGYEPTSEFLKSELSSRGHCEVCTIDDWKRKLHLSTFL